MRRLWLLPLLAMLAAFASGSAVLLSSFSGEVGSKINNVAAFDGTSKALSFSYLQNPPKAKGKLDRLRCVLSVPPEFPDSGKLLVCNGFKDDSAVYLYASSPSASGSRAFLARPISFATEGVAHPYGAAFCGRSLAVSMQDSSLVMAFDATSADWGALPVASFWTSSHPEIAFPRGMLVPSAVNVSVAEGGLQGPRGIFCSRNMLLVADDHGNCVRGYDMGTGQFLGNVYCWKLKASPISIIDAGAGSVYVSLKDSNSVVLINISMWPASSVPKPVVVVKNLNAPAGLVFSDSDVSLLVANRKGQQIIKVPKASLVSPGADAASFIFVDHLEDTPELLHFVDDVRAGSNPSSPNSILSGMQGAVGVLVGAVAVPVIPRAREVLESRNQDECVARARLYIIVAVSTFLWAILRLAGAIVSIQVGIFNPVFFGIYIMGMLPYILAALAFSQAFVCLKFGKVRLRCSSCALCHIPFAGRNAGVETKASGPFDCLWLASLQRFFGCICRLQRRFDICIMLHVHLLSMRACCVRPFDCVSGSKKLLSYALCVFSQATR